MSSKNSVAQDLSVHKWKNRVLIILTDSPSNTIYRKQLNELEDHESGVMERKLLIYQSLPGQYGTGLKYPTSWNYSEDLYDNYNDRKASFKVIMIGLDGEVKLTKNTFLKAEELFRQIDQMPIRKAEMENN